MSPYSLSVPAAQRASLMLAAVVLCSTDVQSAKKKPPPTDDGAAYDLVVLAPPDVQITGSNACDLDEAGNVVGYYLDSENERNGFYYDRAQDSYLVFGPGVEVFGMNNLGEIVGADSNTGEGLYWCAPDATPMTLNPLNGHLISTGFRINDAGIIVGRSQGNGSSVAVAWRVNAEGMVSAPIELPFLEGDTRGSVSDLSEQGIDGISRIVGYSGAVDLHEKAVMWEVAVDAGGLFLLSGPTDLGSLDGGLSAAYGVNSHGDIVGESGHWPFVKPADQSMQPLAGLRKATDGLASGINDVGHMVGRQGYLFKGEAIFKAVLWPGAGSVIDLSKNVALGRDEELESAHAINNAGDILASGYFPDITSDTLNVGCLLIPK